MATTNNSLGSFSDGLTLAAHPGTRIVQPLNGRELRREAARRQQKRTKKVCAPKRGF